MASVNSLISDIQKLSGNLDLPREKSAHIAHAYIYLGIYNI